jgi:hypothetical protein
MDDGQPLPFIGKRPLDKTGGRFLLVDKSTTQV